MVKAELFYRRYFDIDSPFKHQMSIWESIHTMKYPLLLKAPTGSGKTEAVIAPFLAQFIENNFYIAPRLIYALPMRALVNNIANRIEKYAKRISHYISVEVQHGDVSNAPFFIADIVVTTLDQFLYAFARASGQVGRHIDIPAGSIASSIVVFDEAHMYRDGFTFSIMRALMEILQKCHIPFVLMTATMPEILEKSLFESRQLFPNVEKITGEVQIQSNIRMSIEDMPLCSDKGIFISDELLNKMKERKTLIVVNQVKRAQKIYEEIKAMLDLNEDQIVLLHSRFTKTDREDHEKRALSLMPHKENGRIVIPEGIGIVVSTQVLEAGMDFSAELLITELAPADSLIQRAGRCARYKGESGEMIIFPVEAERGHLPYEREHLWNTWEWLHKEKSFNIKNFDEVCSFVDILDYKANDYEAKDTLVDLYECVLYADERPRNIQLRDGKPIKLIVVDLSKGGGRKKEYRIRDAIRKTNIRDYSINVDFRVGWKLLKDGILKLKLNFDSVKGQWDFQEVKEIIPFSYYLLEQDYYDKLKGVIPDASSFII